MAKKHEGINYDPKKPMRLDSFGDLMPWIHKKVQKLGERFYSSGGNEFLYLDSPPEVGGSARRVNLVPSGIGSAVKKYFSYLSNKGELPFDSSKLDHISVYEGEIPFIQPKGKTQEYGGVKVDTGNGEIILVDSRLSDSEKVATVFHELVHGAGYDFPRGKIPSAKELDALEKRTQLETISGLRKMDKDFKELVKTDYDAGSDLDCGRMHQWETKSPDIFREAANYAVASRGSFDLSFGEVKGHLKRDRSGLEKSLVISVIIGLVFGILFLDTNLTGNVIGLSSSASYLVGGILFLVGIVASFFWIKNKNK